MDWSQNPGSLIPALAHVHFSTLCGLWGQQSHVTSDLLRIKEKDKMVPLLRGRVKISTQWPLTGTGGDSAQTKYEAIGGGWLCVGLPHVCTFHEQRHRQLLFWNLLQDVCCK